MNIRILCIGRQPREWVAGAEDDYRTRLAKFADLAIDYIHPEDEHKVGIDGARAKEGEKLLARIRPDDVVIACDLGGQALSSERFAALLGGCGAAGDVVFVIGGSHGLSPAILARADHVISFSSLTFPHELFRVLLLEQIYRACMIRSGRMYHK